MSRPTTAPITRPCRLAPVLLAAAALALGACSDDGGGDGEVTRAQYVQEADALCRRANADAKKLNTQAVNAVPGERGDEAVLAALEPILAKGYEQQRDDVREFTDLEAPSGDRQAVDELNESITQQTEILGQLVEAARDRDAQRFESASEEQDEAGERARDAASQLGLKECASGRNEADSG